MADDTCDAATVVAARQLLGKTPDFKAQAASPRRLTPPQGEFVRLAGS